MPDISRKTIVLTLLGVVGLWGITPLVTYLLPLADMSARGQAGDLFGSINALFSGLAFAGVVFAILLQRQELTLQRQELRETREEMKRTADAQDQAQQALNKTIWAQSWKTAWEVLEEPRVIGARRVVAEYQTAIRELPSETWSAVITESADTVARSFETIGTMIRKGLLPSDYVIDTWSVVIDRNWRTLEDHLKRLRVERNDPFIGLDFEELALAAQAFLQDKGAALEQRLKSRPEKRDCSR
ncbi:hypothetical protein ACVIHC_005871 [Bradyrhizobium diazoefficiens]